MQPYRRNISLVSSEHKDCFTSLESSYASSYAIKYSHNKIKKSKRFIQLQKTTILSGRNSANALTLNTYIEHFQKQS